MRDLWHPSPVGALVAASTTGLAAGNTVKTRHMPLALLCAWLYKPTEDNLYRPVLSHCVARVMGVP
eukprot:7072942-Prymnesium_polylepis.2